MLYTMRYKNKKRRLLHGTSTAKESYIKSELSQYQKYVKFID